MARKTEGGLREVAANLASQAKGDAALALGAAAAKRALEDLTLSPEEKEKKRQEEEAASRAFKVKLALGGVGALLVLLAVLSVLAALWRYAIMLIVVLGLGGVAYWLVKPKVDAVRARLAAGRQAQAAARETQEREARALAAQRQVALDAAEKQRKLEEQLAALKAKGKG
jgi:uncharacterized protein HemX